MTAKDKKPPAPTAEGIITYRGRTGLGAQVRAAAPMPAARVPRNQVHARQPDAPAPTLGGGAKR